MSGWTSLFTDKVFAYRTPSGRSETPGTRAPLVLVG